MIVTLYPWGEARGMLDQFQGPPHLCMALALRFLYLHGLDPDAEIDEVEPASAPGTIVFSPEDEDRNYLDVADAVMRRFKKEQDELDERTRR